MWFTFLTRDQVRKLIENAKSVVSYIGHPATVSLINRIFGLNLQPNRFEWPCAKEDVVVSVVLKRRCQTQDCSDISETDIEYVLAVPMNQCGARPYESAGHVWRVLDYEPPCHE